MTRDEYNEAVATATQIFNECSKPNWDSYDGTPISKAAHAETLRFLALLPESIVPPHLAPQSDGTMCLEWFGKKGWDFSLDILGGGLLVFAGIFGDNEMDGQETFGDTIPKTVLDGIRRVALED